MVKNPYAHLKQRHGKDRIPSSTYVMLGQAGRKLCLNKLSSANDEEVRPAVTLPYPYLLD